MSSTTTRNSVDHLKLSSLIATGKPIEGVQLDPVWLEDQDLTDIIFRDVSFEVGSEFDTINFRGSVWKNAHIPAAFFKNCDMQGVIFDDCTFYDSDTRQGGCFRHSDLSQTEFHNCDLRLSTFPYSQMFSVSFQVCRMSGVSLEGCDFGKVAGKRALKARGSFTDCQLNFSTLCDLDLEGCVFTDCDLSGSNLANTSLVGADLQRSSIVDADTDKLDLSYADLRGGELGALQLNTLRGYRGMLISASQQNLLLASLGIKVERD